jgi:hypothetical protein
MSYQDEYEDQAIARAFDLDDDNEAAMDRAVVEDYQRVLSYLPFEEVEPPAALEDRVVAAALAARPTTVRSIDSAKRARRRTTARWATLGAAVAAAAVVIGFMFATTNDSKPTPGGRVDLAGSGHPAIGSEIASKPGARVTDLKDPKGAVVGKVALSPDGEGAVYRLELAMPKPGQHYWIWLTTSDKVSPMGSITDLSTPVHFRVSGDVNAVKGVAISSESSETVTPDTSVKPVIVASATF